MRGRSALLSSSAACSIKAQSIGASRGSAAGSTGTGTLFAQTPEQMRQATVLSLTERPGVAVVDLPDCAAFAYQQSCPLERFVEIARAAIDPGCVTIRP